MKRPIIALTLLLSFAVITACGGGGGGSPLTKAVITLSSKGALSTGQLIYGIEATLLLPTGVTAKSVSVGSGSSALATDTGVVTATGAAAGAEVAAGSYTPAGASNYQVQVYVTKSTGFPTGEFATVACDLGQGPTPTAANFSVANFKAVDQNGAEISGLTPELTAAIH